MPKAFLLYHPCGFVKKFPDGTKMIDALNAVWSEHEDCEHSDVPMSRVAGRAMNVFVDNSAAVIDGSNEE